MSEQNQNNNNQDQQDNHDYTQPQGIPSVAQNNATTPNQKNAKKLLFFAFLTAVIVIVIPQIVESIQTFAGNINDYLIKL